ncbi:hypothetical protein ACCS66_38285, partial [Rhizobium ruizarguesonis]
EFLVEPLVKRGHRSRSQRIQRPGDDRQRIEEFGSVPAPEKARRSPDGSRLWAIQGGLKKDGIPQGSKDGSL